MDTARKSETVEATRIDSFSRDASSSQTADISEKAHGAQGQNLDQAYWYVHDVNRTDAAEATPLELRALRRKIDWRIVPIMFCCYTMQFIDKISLNVGAVHRP